MLILIVVLTSFIFWIGHIGLKFTKTVPRKGGTYTEGIVGQPRYINPLLSQASEADADISSLIYSGIFKYDENGDVVNDLAEKHEISEDKRVYTIYLKKNVKWHNGEPLTAGDVFYTINTIKNPAYKSPLRLNWQGVEIEQVDDFTVKFILKMPYFGFLEELTVGILPKHIWENVEPEKFSLTENNLRPIGSGPFVFNNLRKNSAGDLISYELKSFPDYFQGESYISNLNFNFYPDEESLITAYNNKEIDGISSISPGNIEKIKSKKSTHIYELNIPRYYAIFFNQTKSIPLSDDLVREALAWGVDRNQIISEVLNNKGTPIFSPFLPQMESFENNISKYDFNPEKAREVLEAAGWKLKEGENVRTKNEQKLEFEIYTLDWPELTKTADLIIEQWKAIGVEANVNVLSVSDLQQNFIRPREYKALLFGQATNFDPDLYFFWHSSQKRDPGLNLALFDDKQVDELLDNIRQETDEAKRIEKHKEFQKIITRELPAIFIYSPKYLYPVSSKLKGVAVQSINSPAGRFTQTDKWHIKTKRIWKK